MHGWTQTATPTTPSSSPMGLGRAALTLSQRRPLSCSPHAGVAESRGARGVRQGRQAPTGHRLPRAPSGGCDQPVAALDAAPGHWRRPLSGRVSHALAVAAALAAAFPGSSVAAETAPEGFLQLLLDFIEGLGPLGPVAYTALVCCFELIPLFPTQPLSLASGLLFGAQMGAACMCVGTTLAAGVAFSISRGVGKDWAEKLIEQELEELDHSGAAAKGAGSGSSAAAGKESLVSKFRHVEEAIEHGSFWKQAGAIFLLRLTPVVPFSASNYLLGLTPLPVAPYLAGTSLGMLCWALVYASLGGASRSLLASGVSADALLADLIDKAAGYTEEVGAAGLLLAVAVAGVWGAEYARKSLAAAPATQQQQGGGAAAGGFARTLMPKPLKDQQLVEQMED